MNRCSLASVAALVLGISQTVYAQGSATAEEPRAAEAAAPTADSAALEAEAQPATFDAAGAQLCSNIDKREPVDEKAAFSTGDKAYLWLKLRPNATKTEAPRMKIKWFLDDKPYWAMDEMPVKWGRVWYYKTVDLAGNWKVEVVDENDTVVVSREFTATGEPYVRPKAEEEATTN